mmetsp:Transcript_2381/g.2664  ORF Transcript_2381/g.2664 Transcript_2381/m.2664 type:complete len:188 (+) Transcript_2381:93-656(+)
MYSDTNSLLSMPLELLEHIYNLENETRQKWPLLCKGFALCSRFDGTLRKRGNWFRWYKTGEKSKVCYFSNGEKTGSSNGWYKNGRKQSERNYINNMKEGKVKKWYSGGELRFVGTYNKNVPHGTCTWWHDNGKVERIATYVRGKLHGVSIVCNADSPLATKCYYKNGVRGEMKVTFWPSRASLSNLH